MKNLISIAVIQINLCVHLPYTNLDGYIFLLSKMSKQSILADAWHREISWIRQLKFNKCLFQLVYILHQNKLISRRLE